MYYNDLWKYNPTSNQWTWMGGSDTPTSGGFASGVFGTKGTASTANIPSSRYGSVSWTDNNGDLWLMGGSGVDSTGLTAMLNDLWRYSPTSGQWTWMTGNSVAGINNGLSGTTSGAYGSEGVASTGNTPGGRFQGASWIDTSGNFWLFGGWGSDSTGTTGLLNDLWEYSPSANTWMWVSGGDNLPPRNTRTIPGVSRSLRHPGHRVREQRSRRPIRGCGVDRRQRQLLALWRRGRGLHRYGRLAQRCLGVQSNFEPVDVDGRQHHSQRHRSVWHGRRRQRIQHSRLPRQMLYWTDLNHNLWLFGGLGGSYQPGDPSAFTYTDLWTAGTAGGASSPAVTLSQTALSFVSSAGTASSPQTVTLTNSGNADLTGIAFGFSNNLGGFSAQSTCPSTLTPEPVAHLPLASLRPE